MSAFNLFSLPSWCVALAWSLIVILAASLIGRLVTRTIIQRLAVWTAKTAWKWDELVIDALRRGIPVWSFLVGLHVAVGLWPLPEPIALTASRVIFVLVWLSVTLVCARLFGNLIAQYGSQFQHAMPVTSLTQNVTKIIVVILGLLMMLNGLGISIAPLLTALGVGGLAVALALQDTLSNLFAGIHLSMARQIRVGDYVKLESGQEGYVVDIGWRATQIRMLPNNMVLVPNNKIGQEIITNYNLPSHELGVTVDLGVDYDSDLAEVERVTVEVAREVMRTVPGGVPSFEPLVRFHTLGDFSINFTVVMQAKEFVDQFLIKHEFIKRFPARYRQEGILIPDSRARISE